MDNENKEFLKTILDKLKKLDYINPDDIPNIDLYMDQVTTFMDEHLQSSKRYNEDKLLTKTMINNYTKNNLLPSPNKKKYSKEHILLLIFIYYFKNILSISDIQSIFNPLTEKYYGGNSDLHLEAIYKEVFGYEREQMDVLIKDVLRKFNKSTEMFSEVEAQDDKEFLKTFSFICMLSFDVYVKKQMIESLIDDSLKKKTNNSGKDKNKDR